MSILIELLGSVALLLWGLRMVRTGVMRAYGTNLKRFARRSEGKIFPAFLSGLVVASENITYFMFRICIDEKCVG